MMEINDAGANKVMGTSAGAGTSTNVDYKAEVAAIVANTSFSSRLKRSWFSRLFRLHQRCDSVLIRADDTIYHLRHDVINPMLRDRGIAIDNLIALNETVATQYSRISILRSTVSLLESRIKTVDQERDNAIDALRNIMTRWTEEVEKNIELRLKLSDILGVDYHMDGDGGRNSNRDRGDGNNDAGIKEFAPTMAMAMAMTTAMTAVNSALLTDSLPAIEGEAD